MIRKKQTPYIFLLALIFIIVFIVGIKYGKKVEQTDKTIHYLVNQKPTPSLAPIIQPTITYLNFQHKECGVSFLYPSYIEVINQSSSAAKIGTKSMINISLDCSKNPASSSAQLDTDEKTATQSITLANKKIIAQKKLIKIDKETIEKLDFTIKNDKNNTDVIFSIDSRLFPLIEKSFSINP